VSIVSDLASRPGVVAAGEYSYRGDRFAFKGNLTEEWARMASIMCRATLMGATMQGRMVARVAGNDAGLDPVRGWYFTGPEYSVCVVANVFCMLDNAGASLNDIMAELTERLADAPVDLV
jgi:roadblock/LC7 domain-containing protein